MLSLGGLFGMISISCTYEYLMMRCPELVSLIFVFILSLIVIVFSIWLFNICLNKKWWK
jgi:hypothetical protein